jgi:hypothetical protein
MENTYGGMIYLNDPIVINELDELYELLRWEDDVTIITGERGLYEWFKYVEIQGSEFVNRVRLSMITNKYFDQRDEMNNKVPKGGHARSYEYHVYIN